MAKLIITDTYFNLFDILVGQLKNSANSLNGKNLVFCEEKVSLMAERIICSQLKGSFNTDVYSFGNYLRVKKPLDKLLSKEGSAMAVKRILGGINLKCFRSGKVNLAPALFELIIQLKSAKVTPSDLQNATNSANGILKNKLLDIATVYSEYERFISENGFEDQSSMLSYLPSVLENSQEVKGSDVYLVGFSGWTSQIRSAITTLLKTAKSVTAILTSGENDMVYVNETVNSFRDLCRSVGVALTEERVDGGMNEQGRTIVSALFNPSYKGIVKKDNANVFYGAFKNPTEEIDGIGQTIKRAVMEGKCRYRDVTVALSDISVYKDAISAVFSALDIPCFLDEQKRVDTHPLITLILAYADVFRKGYERSAVLTFLKNPLFNDDKDMADSFENYLIKYNVNYGRIKEPFVYDGIDQIPLCDFENFRLKLVQYFDHFNVRKLLDGLQVKDKLSQMAETLREIGQIEESAVTLQIYEAVEKILGEMQLMLGDTSLSVTEYVNVFNSGVSALELSIIPQYNDAVFIGGFKETALAKAKYLFVGGLTGNVPDVKADVALLSDGDIDALEQIKVLVEPKIRVVNHRTRECVGLALSAFDERLYLSYPTASIDGKKNVRSEVLSVIENCTSLLPYPNADGYLTKEQGMNTFARQVGEFAEGKTDDITTAVSYFKAVDGENLKPLLDSANKEVKERLDGQRSAISGGETAPTVIEDYYKCPYRAFLSHVLKLRDREEGVVNSLSVGNFMHDVLKEFIEKIDSVTDLDGCKALFESVKDSVLSSPIYSRYEQDKATATTMKRVIEECRAYCINTYRYFINSDFKAIATEAKFGDGANCKFPSIPLYNGKVKLSGKIDRVDACGKYFRVVDYKTGSTDVSDQSLFSGNKLQLYLYAAAVKKKYDVEDGKGVAGLYYLPISDKYEKQEDKITSIAEGKTLMDNDALTAQDKGFLQSGKSEFLPVKIDARNGKLKNCADKDTLESYVDYAVAVSEKAVERMSEGVIVPSPYEGVCMYCEYSALCGLNGENQRTVGKVTEQTIVQSVKGGNGNGTN